MDWGLRLERDAVYVFQCQLSKWWRRSNNAEARTLVEMAPVDADPDGAAGHWAMGTLSAAILNLRFDRADMSATRSR